MGRGWLMSEKAEADWLNGSRRGAKNYAPRFARHLQAQMAASAATRGLQGAERAVEYHRILGDLQEAQGAGAGWRPPWTQETERAAIVRASPEATPAPTPASPANAEVLRRRLDHLPLGPVRRFLRQRWGRW